MAVAKWLSDSTPVYIPAASSKAGWFRQVMSIDRPSAGMGRLVRRGQVGPIVRETRRCWAPGRLGPPGPERDPDLGASLHPPRVGTCVRGRVERGDGPALRDQRARA